MISQSRLALFVWLAAFFVVLTAVTMYVGGTCTPRTNRFVPSGFSSASFAGRLLDDLAIVVTPGTGYGAAGEGYVRLSLTIPDSRLSEALNRLAAWKQ